MMGLLLSIPIGMIIAALYPLHQNGALAIIGFFWTFISITLIIAASPE